MLWYVAATNYLLTRVVCHKKNIKPYIKDLTENKDIVEIVNIHYPKKAFIYIYPTLGDLFRIWVYKQNLSRKYSTISGRKKCI